MKDPFKKKWFILIFAPPGNGKSLEQATMSYKTLKEYKWIEKKYPAIPERILMTNQRLSLSYIASKLNVSLEWLHMHIRYWEQPDEIRYCSRKNCWKGNDTHLNHDIDLFCDEGATLFPATAKGATDDMPLWMKKFIAQHRHHGIRICLLTQDFMGINITARRCLWDSFYMHKVMGSRDISPTLPPVKWIWGIYTKQKIDPDYMKSDAQSALIDFKMASDQKKDALRQLKLVGTPKPHLITRHKTKLYDTTQDVAEIEIKREIEHIEVRCKHPLCGYTHRTHRLK